MSEQCFLRRQAYQATKNGESVVPEDKLPTDCRNCARMALQNIDVQLNLQEKGVMLNADGEPDCQWGMISKEGTMRLIVIDIPRTGEGAGGFDRTYPRATCRYQSGSIVRPLHDLPKNSYL